MKIGIKSAIVATATATIVSLLILAPNTSRTAKALPEFARQYDVPCKACHETPPKLTKMGMAFQANYFNWPGDSPRPRVKGAGSIPLSVFVNSSLDNSQGAPPHHAQFDNLGLTAADGFDRIGLRGGGYWAEYNVAEADGSHPGDLGNVFAAVPISGNKGQLSLAAGQFGAFDYQYGDASWLTATTPAAIDFGTNGITFDGTTPQIALQYFNNRGKLSPDGLYANVGVPFGGALAVNKYSRLYSAQGAYGHVFLRRGYTTDGIFAYRDGSSSYEGIVITRQPWKKLTVIAAASTGTDINGTAKITSIQGDYEFCPELALSARYDSLRGSVHDEYPTFDVNWYPGNQRYLRITGESKQDSGARGNTVFVTLQY